MTTVAYVDAELRARSDQYVRAHDQAGRATQRYSSTAVRAYRQSETAQQRMMKTANGVTRSGDRMGDMFARAANNVAVLDGPLGGVAGRLSSVASGMRAVGPLALGVGVAMAGLAAVTSKATSAYADLEVRQAKTDALLKATGYSAGYTADQLDNMARQVALGTLASTSEIRDAIDVLLTFKSVSGETFEQAIRLSQDMAVVIGGTAKTAALQLGKALEDPVAGLTALKRSGVSFTESEKELVKQLVESNRVLDAQSLILEKVAGQLGGAGAAEAGGLSGAVDTLSQRWEEFLETFGKTSGVASTSTSFLNAMAQALKDVSDAMDPERLGAYQNYMDAVRERSDIRERMRAGGNPNELSSLPIPFKYDKNDWYNDQRRLTELDKEIAGHKEKLRQQEEQEKLAKEQSETAKKLAEQERTAAALAERRAEAQERIAKAMESQLDKASFGSAGKALYNDIFGIQAPQRKTDGPVESNYYFNQAARAAQGQINSGHAVNSDAWLTRMEQIYQSALTDKYHNYDVQGMAEVIKLMEDKAIVQFGDLEKAVAEAQGKSGQYSITKDGKTIEGTVTGEKQSGSVLEVTGETVNLSMAAETAEAMGKEVRSWLEAAEQKQGTHHGTLTIDLREPDGTTSTGTISGDPALLKKLSSYAQRAASRV